jgi:hypothetical protein
MHPLGPEPIEQEEELVVELAQVEDITNPFPEQGKPRCIASIILFFYF